MWGGWRERQGKAALERPRNRHPQARQAVAVMLRLRFDGLERRRHLYRGSAVEHIQKAGIHGNTPPVPVGERVVLPVARTQGQVEVGHVGEPQAELCPRTEVPVIAIAPDPPAAKAQAAGRAPPVEQACEPGISGNRDVVPLRALIDLRGSRSGEHAADVLADRGREGDARGNQSSRS